MTDWAAAHRESMRYLKVAGFSRIGMGLVFSLCGLLGGLVVASATGNMLYGGAAAAVGMVAGFLSSRRGRKVLMQTTPLVVEGAVTHKHVRTSRKGNRFLLVVQIEAAWTLDPDGTRTATPDRVGPRTLTATRKLFDRIQPDDRVVLVCLPTGQAVAIAGDF